MSPNDLKFYIFIDYDNLLGPQKTAGILDVVTKALIQLPLDKSLRRAKCEIRVYGGWYEGTQITRMAEKIAIEIQNDFPKIIRLPRGDGEYLSISANAELAVALMQDPSRHLFDTFRRKGRPANVRVERPADVGCTDQECILPLMKKMLEKGKCPKNGCSVEANNLIYRNEQKIVDTMLTCDLIHAAGFDSTEILLISDDDDFIPPLHTMMLHGRHVTRFHPRNNFRPALSSLRGANLSEMSL